jgi:hypothetical protein
MELTFAPREILQIDDARIVFRNFSGEASKFNNEGNRNFAVIIPDEKMAEELQERGWNVKIKPPRDEEDEPFMYLPVKVKFNDRGPAIYLQTGKAINRLTEDAVGCLDNITITSVSMDIRPYDWVLQEGTPNEKSGRTAYLQSMKVVQEIDRFAEEFEDMEEPPFD